MRFGFFLDIILICLFALIIYICVKRGFVRMTLSGLSFIAAVGLALGLTSLIAPPITRALTPAMQKFIVHQASRILPDEQALDTLASASDKVITVVRAVLNKMNMGADSLDTERDALYELSYGIAYGLYSLILFALSFAAFRALMRILIERMNFIERIPLVGVVDSTLSVMMGIFICIFILFIPAIVCLSIVPNILGSSFNGSELFYGESLLLRFTYMIYPFR